MNILVKWGPLNLCTSMAEVTFKNQRWFPPFRLPNKPLTAVSLRVTPSVQFVQRLICACWTSMDQWSHSLSWYFGFFSSSTHIDPRARWSRREIKLLVCYLIYQRAEAMSTSVAWWIVLGMNRTVTLCIDLSMTEHILLSPLWKVVVVGPRGQTDVIVNDPAVASLHHKPSRNIILKDIVC